MPEENTWKKVLATLIISLGTVVIDELHETLKERREDARNKKAIEEQKSCVE